MARSVLISGENLQTIVAVTFVLTLLAVAFNFYNFTRVQQTHTLAASANNSNVMRLDARLRKLEAELGASRARIDTLEERLEQVDAAREAPAPTPD